MMDRHYRAFLLRCWQLGDEQRFEIAHIQTGATVRATTLAEVIGWLDGCLADRPPAGDTRPGAGSARDASSAPSEGR